jgi:hypothetical protein
MEESLKALNGAKNDVHRKSGQLMLAKSSDKEDVELGRMSETKPSDHPANPNCMPMSVKGGKSEALTQ